MMFYRAISAKENDMPNRNDSFYTVQPGDTLHTLAQAHYQDRNKWQSIGEANAALQGFSPDQPLPAGLQLALPSVVGQLRRITTGSQDTFMTLAQRFYQNANRWPVIRQANPALQSY